MSVKSFDLQPGEQIVLKMPHVQRGRWSMCTGDLILTDRALVYVDRGLLGNCKGYTRFGLDEVKQVLVGEAPGGSAQLEVYHVEGEDEFGFRSGGKRKVKEWKKAIDKQLAQHNEHSSDGIIGGVVQNVGHAVSDVIGRLGITHGDEDTEDTRQ